LKTSTCFVSSALLYVGLMAFFSCKTQETSRGAQYTYEVSCLGTELDGSITVESYGLGKNYADASEQAMKNAVHAVVFKGIKIGVGGCNSSPLILTPRAQEKYEDYFAIFFADKGPYKAFVSLKDETVKNKADRNVKDSKQAEQRMVVVRVERLKLKKQLEKDNIK